ncbi:hypothetical protein BS78_10G146700 [Paspalum vaginatum]|nr:hypothetical protein BS78_10G146700 [Paspalum vaginatum]
MSLCSHPVVPLRAPPSLALHHSASHRQTRPSSWAPPPPKRRSLRVKPDLQAAAEPPPPKRWQPVVAVIQELPHSKFRANRISHSGALVVSEPCRDRSMAVVQICKSLALFLA